MLRAGRCCATCELPAAITTSSSSSSASSRGCGVATSGRLTQCHNRSKYTTTTGARLRAAHVRQCPAVPLTKALGAGRRRPVPINAASAQNVDKTKIREAADLISEMVSAVCQDLFVSEAAAFVREESPDTKLTDAVRSAVTERLGLLDTTFLLTLDGAIAVTAKEPESPFLEILKAIREEVLRQVSDELPQATRILNAALQLSSTEERQQVLKSALQGRNGLDPACDIGELVASTSQYIDDMEEQEVVVDRRLLARLCLVKEELRALYWEGDFNKSGTKRGASWKEIEFQRANVPRRCAAFLMEIVKVSDAARRVGILSKAFIDDWEALSPEETPGPGVEKSKADAIRPGRFLRTLHAMKNEFQELGGQKAMVERLDMVYLEALRVLESIQNRSIIA